MRYWRKGGQYGILFCLYQSFVFVTWPHYHMVYIHMYGPSHNHIWVVATCKTACNMVRVRAYCLELREPGEILFHELSSHEEETGRVVPCLFKKMFTMFSFLIFKINP